MYVSGIKPEYVTTGNDIYFAKSFIDKTLKKFGLREVVVLDERTKRIIGCLTRRGLLKAYNDKKILYLRDASWCIEKIQTVYLNNLTWKNFLEVVYESGSLIMFRSLFPLIDRSDPKKLFKGDLRAEIMQKNIMEALSGKEYSNQNCPYPYRFEVKE